VGQKKSKSNDQVSAQQVLDTLKIRKRAPINQNYLKEEYFQTKVRTDHWFRQCICSG